MAKSDGANAGYYQLPDYATNLQHLMAHKNMNHAMGEIFCATYRYGEDHHSDNIRDLKKIIFYARSEIERLQLIEEDAAIPFSLPYEG